MSNKPSNWYSMDYNERKEWERNQQALEDAEYEKQRAQEEADNAQAEAQRLRREMQAESYAAQEEFSILQDELSTLNTNYERILAERNKLWDICKGLLTYRKEAGAINFQLEKADDFLREMRIAIDEMRGD